MNTINKNEKKIQKLEKEIARLKNEKAEYEEVCKESFILTADAISVAHDEQLRRIELDKKNRCHSSISDILAIGLGIGLGIALFKDIKNLF